MCGPVCEGQRLGVALRSSNRGRGVCRPLLCAPVLCARGCSNARGGGRPGFVFQRKTIWGRPAVSPTFWVQRDSTVVSSLHQPEANDGRSERTDGGYGPTDGGSRPTAGGRIGHLFFTKFLSSEKCLNRPSERGRSVAVDVHCTVFHDAAIPILTAALCPPFPFFSPAPQQSVPIPLSHPQPPPHLRPPSAAVEHSTSMRFRRGFGTLRREARNTGHSVCYALVAGPSEI